MQAKFFRKNVYRRIRPPKVRWQNLGLAVLVMLSITLGNFTQVPIVSAVSCDDVQFIFARGSGEHLGDVSFQAWKSSLETATAGMELKTSFYDLGSKNIMGYQYPAASVGDDFWGYVNLATAFFSGGTAFAFGESVEQGMGELKSYIKLVNAACPKTKFVLGGYSQGAMLIDQSLDQINSNKILYVANFGDPKIYLPEGSNDLLDRYKTPDACLGKNLSPYRVYVPDCKAYRGAIGAVIPYEPAKYAGKIGTWCNDYDILCSSGMSVDDHVGYVPKNLYGDAAARIRRKLLAAFPDKAGAQAPRYDLQDLVFLFDATSSMEYMIDRYKEEAQKLAEKIWASGGRVALYEYRDLQDEMPVRQLCDFSCSKTEFEQELAEITPSGGGDDCESLLSAAYVALSELNWNFGSTKSLFVLTDAPYHSPDRDGTTEAAVVQKSLELDPVNIYVMTKNYTNVQYFKGLTEKTYGQPFDIYREIEFSTQVIYERPDVRLAVTSYEGTVGDILTFDASDSSSYDGSELRFDWDLDGDGKFELQDTGSVVSHQYDQTFFGYVVVKATAGNKIGTMSAKVEVGAQPAVAGSTITKLTTEAQEDKTIKVTFETDAEKVLVFGNGAPLGFIETKDDAGEFIVDNTIQDLEMVLVPYRNERRGISRTLEVKVTDNTISFADFVGTPDIKRIETADPEEPAPEDLAPETPSPAEPEPEDLEQDSSNNRPTPIPSTPLNKSSYTQTANSSASPIFTIPTAPNTGVKSIDISSSAPESKRRYKS